MADANTLADHAAAAIEDLFGTVLKDELEALVAVRGEMDHARRTRLLAALTRLQEQAHNTTAALSRDAAWG